jgi:hypothetical protein
LGKRTAGGKKTLTLAKEQPGDAHKKRSLRSNTVIAKEEELKTAPTKSKKEVKAE